MFAVVAMIFIFVSSGAFGIEDMVSSSGPGLTLLMLLALPVFWAMPMALVCSELGSALPEEGGYYAWTRRALGEFWGFQCGWWSWTCQWVDSAVYIALVQGYVATWWPQLSGWELWLIGAALIAVFAYTNIRGLNIIALSSVVFTIVIVAPFLVEIVLGFAHWHGTPLQPFVPTGQSVGSSLNLGLAIGVWMYSGYDSMSTIAGEVDNPRKHHPARADDRHADRGPARTSCRRSPASPGSATGATGPPPAARRSSRSPRPSAGRCSDT